MTCDKNMFMSILEIVKSNSNFIHWNFNYPEIGKSFTLMTGCYLPT